jgi:ATP synthase protein I
MVLMNKSEPTAPAESLLAGVADVAAAKQVARASTPSDASDEWQEGLWPKEPDLPVQPLTHAQAQALRARYPVVSAWRLIAAQVMVGLLVALCWGALSGQASLWSSLYGALVAVLPNVLMVRGLFGPNAGRSVGGLLFWELVKIGVSVAMLALSPVLVPSLDWAAMLVTMVLCLKVIGVALLWQGREKKS